QPTTRPVVTTKTTPVIASVNKKTTLSAETIINQFINHINSADGIRATSEATTAHSVVDMTSCPPKTTSLRRSKKAQTSGPAIHPKPLEAARRITTRSGEPATKCDNIVKTTLVKMVPAMI